MEITPVELELSSYEFHPQQKVQRAAEGESEPCIDSFLVLK